MRSGLAKLLQDRVSWLNRISLEETRKGLEKHIGQARQLNYECHERKQAEILIQRLDKEESLINNLLKEIECARSSLLSTSEVV